MLEVFHGSTVIVDKPLILPANRTLDYGVGLYTTTSYEQAEKWVRSKLNEKMPVGYVNRYKVNVEAMALPKKPGGGRVKI